VGGRPERPLRARRPRPNGYANIAWAIVGRHDRPWFNRPIYGLVRPMTGASFGKKFDAGAYIRQQVEKG